MITLGGDLRVGRVGYGAMRLTGPELLGDYPDWDGGIAFLRAAVDAGLTLIEAEHAGMAACRWGRFAYSAAVARANHLVTSASV